MPHCIHRNPGYKGDPGLNGIPQITLIPHCMHGCWGTLVTHCILLCPKISQKSNPSHAKVGPKLVRSRSKVGPKSAQSRPKVGPRSTQSQTIISKYINLATGGLKSTPAGRGSIRIFARVCLLSISSQTDPFRTETAQIGRKNVEHRVFGTSGNYLFNYSPMDPYGSLRTPRGPTWAIGSYRYRGT